MSQENKRLPVPGLIDLSGVGACGENTRFVALGMLPKYETAQDAVSDLRGVAALHASPQTTGRAWWVPRVPSQSSERRDGVGPDGAKQLASFVGDNLLVYLIPDIEVANSVTTLPLQHMPLDLWTLANLLFPTIARGERDRLADAVGVTLSVSGAGQARTAAKDAAKVYQATFDYVDQLDAGLLEEAVRLLTRMASAEANFFHCVLRCRAQRALVGDVPLSTPSSGDSLHFLSETFPPSEPLRSTEKIRELQVEDLVGVLGTEGSLAAVLPEHEDRAGQRIMAEAVGETLNRRQHLLVEAGTGIGKSLAYLVPAVLYAVKNGRRVVISTNTKNLQDQLYEKDLPLLERVLSIPFRATVSRGRGNYICLRRWRRFIREPALSRSETIFATRILFWLGETQTGDRQELALLDGERDTWEKVAADTENCNPNVCRYNRQGVCYVARARRRAESAHILIVNHALLLADTALENQLLPTYDDLIIDEAHHLEDEATDQLGLRLEQRALLNLLQRLSIKIGQERYGGLFAEIHSILVVDGHHRLRERAAELAEPAHDSVAQVVPLIFDFFDAVDGFAHGHAGFGTHQTQYQIRLTPGNRRTDSWEQVEELWALLSEKLVVLEAAISGFCVSFSPLPLPSEEMDEKLDDIQNAALELKNSRNLLEEIITSPGGETIYWLEAGARGVTLRSAPLDVGQLLGTTLFASCDCIVLTSATLQVGGSFNYILQRLGLDRSTRCLAIASMFDYKKQALLCVADDIPLPTALGYQSAVDAALHEIGRVSGGQTLILFTSNAALRLAHLTLRVRLPHLTILGQGIDGSRAQLLERFRRTPHSILLGTSSFWEGVDLLGEALTCLVIVKLPFTVPTDPIFAARSEELYGENSFMEYAVPQAVLRLKQGFGRLIRSMNDRGAVVILDSRLVSKRYGRVFLQSLPPAEMRKCPSDQIGLLVGNWLSSGPKGLDQTGGG